MRDCRDHHFVLLRGVGEGGVGAKKKKKRLQQRWKRCLDETDITEATFFKIRQRMDFFGHLSFCKKKKNFCKCPMVGTAHLYTNPHGGASGRGQITGPLSFIS